MPDVKLAVTKSVPWRGKVEEFSNVYTIRGVDIDSSSGMTTLVNAARNAEASVFASSVTFVRAQIYSFGDLGPNFMYHTQTLSGVGSATPATGMYRECALMVRAKLPRTFSLSRSNQPYLRKYLHACANHSLEQSGNSAPSWTPLSSILSAYNTWLTSPGSGLTMISESGAIPIGNWEVCNFMEHRQFHRGRKEY